jgi:hypothetical protein
MFARRGVAEAAVCCGLDAEWPPDTHNEHPRASLVQLAFWSPQHGIHIALLVIPGLVQLGQGAAMRSSYVARGSSCRPGGCCASVTLQQQLSIFKGFKRLSRKAGNFAKWCMFGCGAGPVGTSDARC